MNNVMGVTSDWDCFLFRSAQVQPQFLFGFLFLNLWFSV